jgi:hypothetical protein
MKSLLLVLFIPTVVFCQKRGDNQIIVKGVSFSQVVKCLLDSGYRIREIDSNYKTVSTAFRYCAGTKNILSSGNMSIYVSVKDSTAFITGIWYNDLGKLGFQQLVETKGFLSIPFEVMKDFALSLGPPVEYNKLDIK